ncbi:MAG: type III-A CRISPR-associated RAMP protein Csm3, partial [Candidatus Methanofastidiosia archaeon]
MQFQKNVVISGTIICTTGLSIGGTDVSIDIGGVDKIVVRDPISGLPYIPGSSLKGKMRSLLELAKGKISNDGKPCNCGKCVVCKIFGISANVKKEQKGPTRLIVRDSFPTKETSEKWKNIETLISGAEVKAENWIN